MRDLLDEAALAAALGSLDGWTGDTSAIRRTVKLPGFPAAISLVNVVAADAEALDHHPDIDVRYDTVTFVLSTHSAGGVTELDVELASRVDRHAAAATGG